MKSLSSIAAAVARAEVAAWAGEADAPAWRIGSHGDGSAWICWIPWYPLIFLMLSS